MAAAHGSTARRGAFRPRIVVLGDVVVDVVLAPAGDLENGTDIPGRVMLRQGGSGTTTARWLGRIGARASLVGSVGRDAEGRALVAEIERDGVTTHVVRMTGQRTGRIGVVVAPGGERSFVQDRAAVLSLSPNHLRVSWFAGAALVHIPTYSLLGHPLADAGQRAAELGHTAGALVTIDLSSSRPLLAAGRENALAIVAATRPDLIFTARGEAEALVEDEERLLEIAPIVVSKRGAAGAVVLIRGVDGANGGRPAVVHAPAHEIHAADLTGAGDAFDAGFLYEWLRARDGGGSAAGSARGPAQVALGLAAAAGNRLAERHLLAPKKELRFG